MTLVEYAFDVTGPRVRGDLPGPRSAELLARQARRESNARVYGRHFPIAVDDAAGSFVRDVDGNVFIDFLTGAGVLSLGHGHPELVEVAAEQLGRFGHGLDLPTPAKDAFVEAQLSMLPGQMAERTKMHFCGPTGANAVDAAIKLCKTATGPRRRRVLPGRVPRHHPRRHGVDRAGGEQGAGRPTACPVCTSSPTRTARTARSELTRTSCATNCVGFLERSLRDPNGGIARPAAVLLELVQGEGGVVPADVEFVPPACAS